MLLGHISTWEIIRTEQSECAVARILGILFIYAYNNVYIILAVSPGGIPDEKSGDKKSGMKKVGLKVRIHFLIAGQKVRVHFYCQDMSRTLICIILLLLLLLYSQT